MEDSNSDGGNGNYHHNKAAVVSHGNNSRKFQCEICLFIWVIRFL